LRWRSAWYRPAPTSRGDPLQLRAARNRVPIVDAIPDRFRLLDMAGEPIRSPWFLWPTNLADDQCAVIWLYEEG
jgi:hypothetical protein